MPHSATDTCESRLKNIFATAGARRRATGWGNRDKGMEDGREDKEEGEEKGRAAISDIE